MDIQEVSSRLGVSKRTVLRWIKTGRRGRVLKSKKVGHAREISEYDLLNFQGYTSKSIEYLKQFYLRGTSMEKFLKSIIVTAVLFTASIAEAQWFCLPLPPIPLLPPPSMFCQPCCQPCRQPKAPQCPCNGGKCQLKEEPEDFPLVDLQLAPEGTDEEVVQCFNRINELRNRVGLPALKLDENLCKQAESHCRNMASWRGIFHSGCGMCENVAMGNVSGNRTFEQWRRSGGHYQNLCRRGTVCGLARVGVYWTFVVK